ncbi:MAG: putative PHD type zinc finger protein with BAH domain-containing protein [Cyphobasidiales sp. Tagirdzhanova-0007]|nr:MAG: putative PHD type zinc finger protein with BAH domain-containing protein [Cyphobasidiales sp. Tagirdzhanova-0007]
MAGTVPLSHIRQRCFVMHRDYLDDPEAFKREDDSFVFSQIYDRFMHKPFDIIPTSQVMNAPGIVTLDSATSGA